jgi:hypothetical protein
MSENINSENDKIQFYLYRAGNKIAKDIKEEGFKLKSSKGTVANVIKDDDIFTQYATVFQNIAISYLHNDKDLTVDNLVKDKVCSNPEASRLLSFLDRKYKRYQLKMSKDAPEKSKVVNRPSTNPRFKFIPSAGLSI